MNSKLKSVLKTILPKYIKKLLMRLKSNHQSKYFENLSTEETFTKIYEKGLWGKGEFNSGTGSHTGNVVDEYHLAMGKFLTSFSTKPNVVDLGCGDFAVGSKLREYCNNYIACDVVDALIKNNRKKFSDLDVDFRVLDITDSALPQGDVIFVRQVLQHLKNSQIHQFISKMQGKYQYMVLTEHLPDANEFIPNVDKRNGPDIRVYFDSGVVLTEEPFNLKCKSVTTLCDVNATTGVGGRIQTSLYEFEI